MINVALFKFSNVQVVCSPAFSGMAVTPCPDTVPTSTLAAFLQTTLLNSHPVGTVSSETATSLSGDRLWYVVSSVPVTVVKLNPASPLNPVGVKSNVSSPPRVFLMILIDASFSSVNVQVVCSPAFSGMAVTPCPDTVPTSTLAAFLQTTLLNSHPVGTVSSETATSLSGDRLGYVVSSVPVTDVKLNPASPFNPVGVKSNVSSPPRVFL